MLPQGLHKFMFFVEMVVIEWIWNGYERAILSTTCIYLENTSGWHHIRITAFLRQLDWLFSTLFTLSAITAGKLRVTDIGFVCDGKQLVTSAFSIQRASKAENVYLSLGLGLGDTGRDRWGHCARGCGCLGQVGSQLPLEDVSWGSLRHGGGQEVPLRDGAVNKGVLQLSCPPWLGFEFVAVLLPCSAVTVF